MNEENENSSPAVPPDFQHEPEPHGSGDGQADPRLEPSNSEGSALLRGKAWLEKTRANAQVDLMSNLEWLGKAIQKKGTSFFGKFLTLLICAYFFSDLAALFAGKLIPEPPSVHGTSPGSFRRTQTLEDYGVIFSRNLFNSKGLIPGEETITTPGTPVDPGGAPVRTTLPFNLVGTLILQNEIRSIATIEDKSASLVYPVRVNDEIPSKAKILKIEPNKVTFLNISSGRREFVDLPEDVTAINPRITLGSRSTSGIPGIEQTSGSTFNIARSEVDKALSNLNNILTEARAVPNFENGVPAGYKLFQIVPGSIYDKLGFKNGDVINGLDGQPITDPGKAFEMLSKLKETPHLEIAGKRDGRPFNFSYDIR
jgi:general secretion pathway protein C